MYPFGLTPFPGPVTWSLTKRLIFMCDTTIASLHCLGSSHSRGAGRSSVRQRLATTWLLLAHSNVQAYLHLRS